MEQQTPMVGSFIALLSRLIAGAGLAACLAAAAAAEDYPARAVKIIVPFPAGGTADLMPRVIGDWLSRKWKQAVVIENKAGAGGNIGAEAVFNAEPDGYTLLSSPAPPLVINQSLYPKLGFDPRAFVPVSVMGLVPTRLRADVALSWYCGSVADGSLISSPYRAAPSGSGKTRRTRFASSFGIWLAP